MCMLCRSLFVLLYFFFWRLCCLFFFHIRILITPLVYSNSSELLLNFVVSMISPLYNGRWFYWLIKQGYQTQTTYHHMHRTNSITLIKLIWFFFCEFCVSTLCIFLSCFGFFFVLCVCSVSCAQHCPCLWIVHT
jgi:hypothetical protein